MVQIFNIFNRCFYCLLILIPVSLAAISIYSYLLVYNTFGSVPETDYYTPQLIASTGKPFPPIFPMETGRDIIVLYFFSILTAPLFICLLRVINYYYNQIKVYKWFAITTVGIHVIVFFSMRSDLLGWYISYALD